MRNGVAGRGGVTDVPPIECLPKAGVSNHTEASRWAELKDVLCAVALNAVPHVPAAAG